MSRRESGVKRRWRPGVRKAGWISPRFTARISVDLLIPSQRAASLVESAGFIYFPLTGANASSGANLRSRRRADGGLGGEAAQLVEVLGPRGGDVEVAQAGLDQLAEAPIHGVHAFLAAGLQHIAQLAGLSLFDQVLDRDRVEQDLEGSDP